MYVLDISVSENREVILNTRIAGNTLENNVTLLNFEIPKAYSDYYKYLDIIKGDSNKTQTVLSTADEIKFSYQLPYELTDKLVLQLQLVMKKGESIFKSNIFKLLFNPSLCATQCLEGEYIDTIEYIMENKADLNEIDKLKSAMEAKLDKSSYYDYVAAQETVNDKKVDKLDGKGLSANDYTDAEKEKLSKLPTNEKYQAEILKINENIDLKADKTDTYSKDETNSLISELDDKKADIESVLPIENSYHRDYIDELLSLKAEKSDTYSKGEIDAFLSLKTEKANVYTKEEVETSLKTKENLSNKVTILTEGENPEEAYPNADAVVQYVANKVEPLEDVFNERIGYLENDMSNKADISDTYTKDEIDSQITAVNGYIGDVYDDINEQLGSIETALDNIIAIQEALIGGES